MSRQSVFVLLVFAIVGLLVQTGTSCPFCSAVSQTFREEIAAMDVVVMAELVESVATDKPVSPDPSAVPAKSKFEITKVIKGQDVLGDSRTIETLYFGTPNIGKTYLIMGVDPPEVMWSSPFEISERAQTYIQRLTELPTGPERLEFFLSHLEGEDEVLTRDAYDEFARAPYDEVQTLKGKMDHDQLVGWITDSDIPTSRRRLYLTLLGICGTADDIPMLEEMLRSDEPKAREGRDAMIACYLILKGPEGLPLVEELFLANQEAEYLDTYNTIMALRFHGTEMDVIPRERLLVALRHILDRPELADLVIADFARWEDWSVMDRLVQLFKDADEQSNWAREPVIRFLRACPLPEADEHIKALAKIDPDAVKRADIFFPFVAASASAREDTDPSETASAASSQTTLDSENQPELADDDTSADAPLATGQIESETVASELEDQEDVTEAAEQVAGKNGNETPAGAPADDPEDDSLQAVAPTTEPPVSRRTIDPTPLAQQAVLDVNVVSLLSMALLLGIILLVVMWFTLRGRMVRTKP